MHLPLPLRRLIAASFFLLQFHAAHAQESTLAAATRTLKTALSTAFVEGKDYSLQQVDLTDSTEGYKLVAKGSFLGSSNLTFAITLANLTTLREVSLRFPENAFYRGGNYQGLLKQDFSHYFPEHLRARINLISVRLGFDSNKLNSMGMALGIPNSKLSMQMGMSLRECVADVEIDQVLREQPTFNASMKARLFLNATESVAVLADLSSNPENWSLSAATDGITFGAVLRGMGIPQPATFPVALWNASLRKGNLTYTPNAGAFALQAQSPFGEIQCRLTAPALQGQPSYLLGLAPGSEVRFASMDPSLEVLDALGLQNTAIVISSEEQTADMEIFRNLGVDANVGAGISLMMLYNLDALSPELSKLLGKTTLLMRSTLSNKPADLRFSVLLNSRIPLDEKSNAVMTEANLNLVPDPAGFKVSMGTMLELKVNKELLRFASEIGFDVTNLELQVKGLLNGTWPNPFGMAPGLVLSDLGLGFGVSFKTSPIPLPTLEMKGKLRAGQANAPLIAGDVAMAMDPADPSACMLDAAFAQLKLGDIVAAFASSVKVPDEIKTTIQTMVLNDCRLSVVPNPAGVTLLGRRYEPGFLIAGKTTIGNQYASVLFALESKSGISAAMGVKSIVYNPYFSLTGSGSDKDPKWSLSLSPDIRKSAIGISGKAKVLGLEADARMRLLDAGIDMAVSGTIFQAFKADLLVKGGALTNGAGYTVKATMKQDLFSYIKEYGSAEIDKATKENQQTFRDANAQITRDEAEVKRLDGLIAANRRTVQEEREADCKKFNAAKADVDEAQAEVNKIQRDINSLKSKISKLKKEIDEKPWTAAENGIKIGDYGLRIGGLETGKKAASLTLDGYKEILNGLQGICKTTPIDLDPRISGLIAGRESALFSLAGARAIVNGTGTITGGSLKATRWIVTNGNPMGVLDIKEAFFEGNLSQQHSGNVSMRVKGTFAGERLETSFSFSFSDPKTTVEAFARSLMK